MNDQLDKALKVLNEALAADPEATQLLFASPGLVCNQALADHPTIQVAAEEVTGAGGESEVVYVVRPLGVINGVVEVLTGGRIAMVQDEMGKIVGFEEWKQT